MPGSTPLKKNKTRANTEDDASMSHFGSQDDGDDGHDDDGHDEGDEGEEDGQPMTQAERRRARGDIVGDGSDDQDDDDDDDSDADDDDDDDSGDEDGDDDANDDQDDDEDDDGQDDDGDERDGEGDDDDASADTDPDFLRSLAGSGFVPKARFNEVLNRLKQLEEAAVNGSVARTPDAQDPPEPKFDTAAKIKERNEALLEGDTEKANLIDSEILEHNRKEAGDNARQAIREALEEQERQKQQRRMEKVATKLAAEYPQIREGAKEFDGEAVADIVELRNSYIRRGMPMDEALAKATKRILGGPVTPKGPKTPSGKTASVPGQDNRSVRDKRRALKLARSQPANIGKNGSGNGATNGSDPWGDEGPSEKQLRKMTPKERARARGDFV